MRLIKDKKDDKEYQKVPPDSVLLREKDLAKQSLTVYLKDVDLGY